MKKNILIIGGIVVLVLLVASAALIGGRLLHGQGMPVVSSGNSGLRISPNGGPATSLDIQPAKELPQTSAEARGLFDHRDNNSIFVKTGRVTMMVKTDANGNVESSSNASGPAVEVVVTKDTIIYHDTTLEQYNGQPPAGEKIQQVLEPGSLNDAGQDSLITVWGKKTGNRIIADVFVYTTPSLFTK
ncbi:MAG TPA: hypothetical protein VK249_17435 [Anaerolineales bacterium]|nr:hypothetical protein [Anaerolineales bacterium]